MNSRCRTTSMNIMWHNYFSLTLLFVVLCLEVSEGASKVDHHTVKMHTAFIKARVDNDFSHWKAAFEQADDDRDGRITVQDVVRVFKEHYNLYHEEKPRGMAAETHFMEDARDFAEMVAASDGWDMSRQMTEDEFMDKMHVYVDLKAKERGALYEMAAHIF